MIGDHEFKEGRVYLTQSWRQIKCKRIVPARDGVHRYGFFVGLYPEYERISGDTPTQAFLLDLSGYHKQVAMVHGQMIFSDRYVTPMKG